MSDVEYNENGLDVDKLTQDLLDSLSNMTDDKSMCDAIMNSISEFVKTGIVITEDKGMNGNFIGSGLGEGDESGMKILQSTIESSSLITTTVCKTLKLTPSLYPVGDSLFANALSKGIVSLLTSDNTIITVVVGTLSGNPYGGGAVGKLEISTEKSNGLTNDLVDLFQEMYIKPRIEKDFDGDEYFATELAKLIHELVKSGTVKTEGVGNLQTVKGEGKIT